MAFRWLANDGPSLNAGLVAVNFQGIPTSIAKKPYIFVIFQGGGGPDLLSPLWIHPCQQTTLATKELIVNLSKLTKKYTIP